MAGLALLTPMQRLFSMARSPGIEGVHELAGEVRVNGLQVSPGSAVAPGDVVETGPDSRVIYAVGRSVFLQRDESRVEIHGSSVDAGDEEENPVVHMLRVLSGKLLSVHARGELLVETSSASIGIRGTGLYIDAQASRTYVCICYGTADLRTIEGETLETVTTRHHESPRYLYPADAATRIEQAPVVDHTDDELILLESLVGRQPPFVSDGGDGGY